MRAADRLAAVRAEICARQDRDRIFAGLSAHNPRWAIIQELEAAALAAMTGGSDVQPWVPLGKLIRAAGMTQTTGLRVIDALVLGGWLQSKRDPADERRRLIALGAKAVAAISRYRARFGYPRPAKILPTVDLAQIDLEDAIAAAPAPARSGTVQEHTV
jgi:DNA-binding MarR family transcriptional regulator